MPFPDLLKLQRLQRLLRRYLIIALLGLTCWLGQGLLSPTPSAPPDLFDAVWQTVNEHFYDPNFNGRDWDKLGQQYRQQVVQAPSRGAKMALINEMLGQLNTSHTHLYTADEPAYYQLLGIFYPRLSSLRQRLRETFPEGKVRYADIGLVTRQSQGKTFAKAVLEGSPAATSGIQVGDQILNAAGLPYDPVPLFRGQANQSMTLLVQKTPDRSSRQAVSVTPKLYDSGTMFLEAMDKSVQMLNRSGQQIGYIHVWSYAGDQYQQQLEEELIYGRLKDTDALVLDLREGWGGSPLTALHPFTARGPSITNIDREGKAATHSGQWQKPVIMLVNEGSRSAKEILAYAFQHYDIGPVVGSPTPGAVVAGRPFLMPDLSLLYVAVADVYVDTTVRLEGVGITPDVVVPFPLEYAQGQDPQKERAIALALEALTTHSPHSDTSDTVQIGSGT